MLQVSPAGIRLSLSCQIVSHVFSGNSPVFHLIDYIGNAHRGFPVRDQNNRFFPARLIQRVQDNSFVQRIQITGRLVQQKERRIMEKGAGNPDPLARV